ncbi:MAG: carbohydrate kinase family protein [Clostridia bacterium]|nr:carbohydrate kinase family protein [Clostridia bacterium]
MDNEQNKAIKEYVVVIGGANVDMLGVPFLSLSKNDSAPGKLSVSSGGVGRNITENLARLGVPVKFITAFGNDASGVKLKKELEDLGADLSLSLSTDKEPTSTYICLSDEHGEMQYALSDMRILDRLNESFFSDKFDVINKAKCVVLDTNLGDILGYLVKRITAPIFLDTVSAQKTEKCRNYVKGLYFVKPNVVETEALLNVKIVTDDDVKKAAEKILSLGNKNVIISLGEKGAYFSDGKKEGFLPSKSDLVVSTTGAGDAFMAAVIYGYIKGLSLEECAQLGLKASKITISDENTVSKNITKLKTN